MTTEVTLPGSLQSIVELTDSGHVLGFYSLPGGSSGTFVWNADDGISELGVVQPRDISNAGVVTGSTSSGEAFVWSSSSGTTLLGKLPGHTRSDGYAIDDEGTVFGVSSTATQRHAFVWSHATGMQDLGSLGSLNVVDVNTSGLFVGGSGGHAYKWDPTGGLVRLQPDVGFFQEARRVNEQGAVAGYWSDEDFNVNQAFYWSASVGMVAPQPLSEEVVIAGLNDAGSVVGLFCDPAAAFGDCVNGEDGIERFAFVWSEETGLTNLGNDLGSLDGTIAAALDINDDGVVVGVVRAGSIFKPFVRTETSGMEELALEPVGNITEALKINDAGVIAGRTLRNFSGHLVVWTPTSAGGDTDGDGIDDDVDTNPDTPSASFLHAPTDPDTSGRIVDADGLAITVRAAANPADGVRVSVAGPASALSTLEVCGQSVQMPGGSEAVYRCASVVVSVLAGEVTVSLGSGLTVVSVPAGGSAEVSEASDGTFTVQNLGTTDVAITVDGVETSVSPGQTLDVTAWDFQGFTAPVDNPDVLNVVRAGQTVPLKWRLVYPDGTPVSHLTAAHLRVSSLSCADGETADLLEESGSGASGLQNLGDGYYGFNWRTPKTYARSCKTLHVDLGEGIERTALFKFTR